MRRVWIKLYVDQCLRGSMIEELEPSQRWMWIGLLLLAGDSAIPGVIYRRKDANGEPIGYSHITIAETLDVDPIDFEIGLKKMIEKQKIVIESSGIIRIVNWTKYQSEYLRQKPYRSQEKSSDDLFCNLSDVIEGEGDIEGDREREKRIGSPSLPKNLTELINIWNEFAKVNSLSQVTTIPKGSKRERMARARLKDPEFNFKLILGHSLDQKFLFGDNDRGWKMTFDWIITPTNYPKVLENQYLRAGTGMDSVGTNAEEYAQERRYWKERAELKAKLEEEFKDDPNIGLIITKKISEFAERWNRRTP